MPKKKILFITACLEPGQDGVGDYSRILAAECQNMGHEVALLSVHDPFPDPAERGIPHEMATLRLSTSLSWKARIEKALTWVKEEKPAVVFFQFVIYGYHPKGLPIKAWPWLIQLLQEMPELHIMFHEPWIGRSVDDPLHHRVIGRIQRGMIRQLYRKVQPAGVYTSNTAFQALLKNYHVPARLLPLPSNIPYDISHAPLMEAWLQEKGLKISDSTLRIGHFGRIPHFWHWEALLEAIPSLCLKTGKKKAALIFAGRSDRTSSAQMERYLQEKAPHLQVIHLGAQPEEMISSFLQYVDLGLATTSPQILGKSGAFAAYREHGLPVLLAGVDETFRLPIEQTAYTDYLRCFSMESIPGQLSSWMVYPQPYNTRERVATQFLQDQLPTEKVYESSRH